MIAVLIIGYVLLAITIISLMIKDAVQERSYLLSVRNIFLIGFLVFQVTSPLYPLSTGLNGQFDLADPVRSGSEILVSGAVFFGLFYLLYPRLPLMRKVVRVLPVTKFNPGPSLCIAISIALTVTAVLLHFGVNVPLIGVLARFLAISFSAIACGLVAWVWAPRLYNPAYAMLTLGVLAVNSLNVITGAFGRRELVAVLGCFLWGMFYSWWRQFDPRRAIAIMVIVGLAPTLLLALYTSARASAEHDRTASEHVQAMLSEGSVSEGMMMLLSGQNAGGVSLWCAENFPENFDRRPLFTMRYVMMYPVPRAIWRDKPQTLSKQLPYFANMVKVHKDRLTIGPGILGHASAEGGWYALVIYAIILAYVCRFFDEMLLKGVHNPLIVLPVGSALGQVLGLPRGETGVFLFILVFSVIGSYVALVIVSKILYKCGFGHKDIDGYLEHEDEYGWDSEAEVYGDIESNGHQGWFDKHTG
tara:strand:- start:1750 stop:3168 length:1419 start_codon:yes stop_codon:yes gene_type:complete